MHQKEKYCFLTCITRALWILIQKASFSSSSISLGSMFLRHVMRDLCRKYVFSKDIFDNKTTKYVPRYKSLNWIYFYLRISSILEACENLSELILISEITTLSVPGLFTSVTNSTFGLQMLFSCWSFEEDVLEEGSDSVDEEEAKGFISWSCNFFPNLQ